MKKKWKTSSKNHILKDKIEKKKNIKKNPKNLTRKPIDMVSRGP